MDINELKYNQALFETKTRLEQELKFINKEIKERQNNCKHLCVCLGYDGAYPYRDTTYNECLFCGEKEPNEEFGRYIEAYTYKRIKYHEGYSILDREPRKKDLLNLWINLQIQNPNMTEEQIIEELKNEIKKDEEETKTLEKELGVRLD